MGTKKSQTKSRSSVKTTKVTAGEAKGISRKLSEKTAKKIPSAKTPLKAGSRAKTASPISKVAVKRKITVVPAKKTVGEKVDTTKTTQPVQKTGIKKSLPPPVRESAKKLLRTKTRERPKKADAVSEKKPPQKTAKAEKTIKEKIAVKKSTGKKPAETITASKSSTPAKKEIKTSPVRLPVKSKAKAEKTVKKAKTVEAVSEKKKLSKAPTANKPTKRKISAKKMTGEKTSGKKPAEVITAGESSAPDKKKAKTSSARIPSKSKAKPEKTVKRTEITKTSSIKTKKSVPGKKAVAVASVKKIKTVPEAIFTTTRKKQPAAQELTIPPKKKSLIRELPEKSKARTKKAPQPAKKTAEVMRSLSPITVRKKKMTTAFKKAEPLTEVPIKTAAQYPESLEEKIKVKRPTVLKIFLPKDELFPEETSMPSSAELPEEYGENELLLMEVDPSIVFVSWEITPADIFGEPGELTLRVYDVTGSDFDSSPANSFFDISLKKRVDSKFFDIKMSGRTVIMEIGLLRPDGTFKAIKRSNQVSMPALQTFEELGISGTLTDSDRPIGY